MTAWDATSVIIAKRDGNRLPDEAIDWFIRHYTAGEVADEQAAALLMAIYFRGMEPGELHRWTQAMIDSGTRVDLSHITKPTVDKHSTGGVGDKVSLVLGPVVAACGAAMPQVSGRGLGHTGGTLDKMASIPHWDADLAPERLAAAMDEVGAVITAASDSLAPADKKLYALRDVTGTVPSIPLIASSIMSKKIASGTSALVLDVKVGRGAFMTTVSEARQLAETMVQIGQDAGVKTVALLTRMDQPLGRTVGNSVEVTEAVDTLEGNGPDDLVEVTMALADEMLSLVGIKADPRTTLADGSARKAWDAMVSLQSGNPDAPLPLGPAQRDLEADTDGYLGDLDALTVGLAAMRLGAGRVRKEDDVDHGAGIELLVKPGEPVQAGQPVLRLYTGDATKLDLAVETLDGAIGVTPEPISVPPAVIERVS